MNDNIEYEKFAQEIYNEILKNLYVKNVCKEYRGYA